VKKREHSKNAIAFRKRKTLRKLRNVGADVVVREHDAFRLPRAPAGENDRGNVVQAGLRAVSSKKLLQHCHGHQPGHRQCGKAFDASGILRQLFQQDDPARNLDANLLAKRF
jgi:hypothetical protein